MSVDTNLQICTLKMLLVIQASVPDAQSDAAYLNQHRIFRVFYPCLLVFRFELFPDIMYLFVYLLPLSLLSLMDCWLSVGIFFFFIA